MFQTTADNIRCHHECVTCSPKCSPCRTHLNAAHMQLGSPVALHQNAHVCILLYTHHITYILIRSNQLSQCSGSEPWITTRRHLRWLLLLTESQGSRSHPAFTTFLTAPITSLLHFYTIRLSLLYETAETMVRDVSGQFQARRRMHFIQPDN